MAMVITVVLPSMTYACRRTANQMKNSSQLRGIQQSAVVFASSNNTFLPGLDRDGNILRDGQATGFAGSGDKGAARFWILLDGQFIGGDLLLNPKDPHSLKYTKTASRLTTANYSYASLAILGSSTSGGRCAEWRDNANSTAVLWSDRNIGINHTDRLVKSYWTEEPGTWRGNLVWGDNHAEFIQTNRGLSTRYFDISQTNDNLFATGPAPGVTDNSTSHERNALMLWN